MLIIIFYLCLGFGIAAENPDLAPIFFFFDPTFFNLVLEAVLVNPYFTSIPHKMSYNYPITYHQIWKVI